MPQDLPPVGGYGPIQYKVRSYHFRMCIVAEGGWVGEGEHRYPDASGDAIEEQLEAGHMQKDN